MLRRMCYLGICLIGVGFGFVLILLFLVRRILFGRSLCVLVLMCNLFGGFRFALDSCMFFAGL